MTAKSLRQQYINSIMKNKYADDDDKYYDSNIAFLETLSLKELAKMADNNDNEEEFDLKGEVQETDFDEEELL